LNIYIRNAKLSTQLVFSLILVFSLCACQKTTTVENSKISIQPVETTPVISTSTFENQSLNLPLEWSEYEISPNDVRYQFEIYHFPRFKVEYPKIFKLADINKNPFPHFNAEYTDIAFLCNSGYQQLPRGEIRIAIYKPGVWGYNTISDLVKGFGLEFTQYSRVESSMEIDGIQSTLVKYYNHEINVDGVATTSTLCKFAVLEYQGYFWQILLFWTFETQEPPEMDLYFIHLVETFHFVDER
jgi:hypothetical protein